MRNEQRRCCRQWKTNGANNIKMSTRPLAAIAPPRSSPIKPVHSGRLPTASVGLLGPQRVPGPSPRIKPEALVVALLLLDLIPLHCQSHWWADGEERRRDNGLNKKNTARQGPPVSRLGRCRWEVKKLPGGSRALFGCDCSRQDEVSTDKVRPLMDGQSRELDSLRDGSNLKPRSSPSKGQGGTLSATRGDALAPIHYPFIRAAKDV
ncbi:hypothetical protein EYF80_007269 [Liparis tanakae]|uniref:Uncharacterized protein n=1 Tax=Liparis tanakae TaxID=230148 RepID=A0A4Z2IY35_9TELE|nr:hypothetical protein EYF80_007269 [Liparis tanakae]